MQQTLVGRDDRPASHPKVESGRIGVLLVNLGTPTATDYWSMRRYLQEFLTDRRVIELPPLLWRPILELFILTTRPQRKGRDYAAIWNREADESPLMTTTRSQAHKLAARVSEAAFGPESGRIVVDWAMRYGQPNLASRIQGLKEAGCDRLLLVPLYPQYAAATTASVCDKTFETLARMRWQPTLRVAPPWHDDAIYIGALADSVRRRLAESQVEPQMIVASFHGVPKSTLLAGDPYHCQCAKTARLLREALGLPPERFMLTFQSRFGRAEWLQPYTDETMKALPGRGVKRVCVVTPGFVADCLEDGRGDRRGKRALLLAGRRRNVPARRLSQRWRPRNGRDRKRGSPRIDGLGRRMTVSAADVCVVTTSCANEGDARRLGRALIEARLAACVQILPIRSLYAWRGEICDEPEVLLLIKARRTDWSALEAAIRAGHTYETPEILAFDLLAGHAPYLDWLMDATGAPAASDR